MNVLQDLAPRIASGCAAMGVALPAAAADRLAAYLALIAQWNQVYNLTAVRDVQEMVARHVLDSLAVLPFIEHRSLADLGSGAGLPGIQLAILRPEWQLTLVESNGKKARFLRTAVRELGLSNVSVAESRIEAWRPAAPPEAAIARALATVTEILRWAAAWLPEGGSLYALKGPGYETELQVLPAGYTLAGVHALAIPGLDAARHLVVLKRVRQAPEAAQ